jgi:dephospho-CoA kinase
MKIGLTGDIGSGKSSTLECFAALGCRTVSADALVHELLSQDEATIAEVVAVYGNEVLLNEGGIDRRALGAFVFREKNALKKLEEILHPRIRLRWEGFLAEEPSAVSVVEIPLLFEKRLENLFDWTVCIWSSLEVKTRRLMGRNLSEEAIRDRMSAQMNQENKAHRADFLIINNGTLEFLRMQVIDCLDTVSSGFLS